MQATISKPNEPATANPRELAGLEGTCITIYLGGHKAGSGSRPMNVRLRGMLVTAERLLEARGVLPTDREDLLTPLRDRVEDPDLEMGHAAGVAMFRTTRRLEQVPLPGEMEDMVAVESRPILTPLARGLQTNREFLLLAVSRKNTRLLECGPGSCRAVDLPADVPRGLEEFEGFDAPDPARGQAGGDVSFALDTFAEKQHLHLHDFCRALDRGLQPLLERRGLPLVLAGATAELVAYRAVNRYARLAPDAIEASPDDGRTDAALAESGRAVIRGWHPAEERHARELYLRDGPAKKSASVEQILRAAAEGRVLHLMVGPEARQTGDVDRILDRVLLSGAPRGEHDDLVNAASVETWRHGGDVWFVADPPEGAAIAGVFRW